MIGKNPLSQCLKVRAAWEVARSLDHLPEMDKEALRLLNDEDLWAETYKKVEQRLAKLKADYENTRFLPNFYMMKARQREVREEAARLRQSLNKLQEAFLVS